MFQREKEEKGIKLEIKLRQRIKGRKEQKKIKERVKEGKELKVRKRGLLRLLGGNVLVSRLTV